jgi:hypothetical protein
MKLLAAPKHETLVIKRSKATSLARALASTAGLVQWLSTHQAAL